MIVATQPKRQRGVAIAHDAIAVRGLMRECRKSWEGAPKHASLLRDVAMVQDAVFRLARLLLTALHSWGHTCGLPARRRRPAARADDALASDHQHIVCTADGCGLAL